MRNRCEIRLSRGQVLAEILRSESVAGLEALKPNAKGFIQFVFLRLKPTVMHSIMFYEFFNFTRALPPYFSRNFVYYPLRVIDFVQGFFRHPASMDTC